MFDPVEDKEQTVAPRSLGRIPVRNLWLLMLYASDLYRYLGSRKVDVEDNPEKIADLVAEILCHQVEERLMRNLSYGYQSKVSVVNRVRGRIDALTTERKRLLDKGRVCCRFEELTVDTQRYRYVRSALDCLACLTLRPNLVRKCKGLALSLERVGVGKVKPVNYSGRSERFGRHDIADQKMVAAADLAFSLSLPTEFDGQHHLSSPSNQVHWLRKLFENAISGFYSATLNKQDWKVVSGKKFDWNISEKSPGIEAILPTMKTDIIVDSCESKERLVIDTKFNSITTKGWYRDESIRSGYVYQMYAYLRSQEDVKYPMSLSSMGMLLHPAVDTEVTERATIQEHSIWFCTVNLGESNESIRSRLLNLLDQVFTIDRLSDTAK